ncbi:hypothetical protein [Hydrogenophaga sp. PAMC20947]|uniref:hypothetical protein n=1 Tax=Hydrogenophaga sp. PAMC20947 TaxID=2565558 RepID=UPI001FFA0CF2|nr:hypothetical protein [Hydrogenophaga sp. PAMC20947]
MRPEDVVDGVKGCDFLYTDVWVAMGGPEAVWIERIQWLMPYQVNAEAMKKTGNPRVYFMHCLPAFHSTETEVGKQIEKTHGITAMEATDEVFEHSASIVSGAGFVCSTSLVEEWGDRRWLQHQWLCVARHLQVAAPHALS